uniref:Uncharacterized protein n=1 Tax=Tanacetum cinerariifolium TaxID=118510 RepID=A0A6L2MT65_TANCI|nr:hypothetical protein [Tanacetum cinerariifolium]
MFEIGSHKSLPKHVALYKALEASMEREQRDEFLAKKDKSRKRRRDDQDPPTLPPDSDLSKRRRHDTGASGSSQPQAPHKGSGQALSISKMKAARCHNFGLKLLKFYIDRHIADSSSKVVRTYMRILSVVSIKAFSRYGYDYLKEITLRRADYQEYTITEKDFKSLYPSDFETRICCFYKWVESFSLGIKSYHKQLNLTKPGWDAKGFEYKNDYTIIDSPHAVVFLVELDFRVKEYMVNRLNPGMNTLFWTDKDVARRKEFIHAIE